MKQNWFSHSSMGSMLLWASIAFPLHLSAQEVSEPESYLRLHYTKREVQVPMRDGVKLFTAVYSPRDTTKKYPVMMTRTPYGVAPYGEQKYRTFLGPSMVFAKEKFIFVYQDVRGRFQSEGKFVHVTPHLPNKKDHKDIDESTDTYDTITWLLEHVENHNGRVGQWGISYPGFYASAGMIDAHPALKAVSPQAPVGDWYFDDFLHHGAFFLAHAFRWLTLNSGPRKEPTTEPAKPFNYPKPDGYELFLEMGSMKRANELYLKDTIEFWNEMIAHPNRDEFWERRAIHQQLKKVAPAVMVVGGWFDAEDLYGTFVTYRAIEKQNPNVFNVLVVGPWYHGGWAPGRGAKPQEGEHLGAVSFGSKTSVFYREQIELPFFVKYLKDQDVPALPEATVFETGSNRWRTFDTWPPKQVQGKTIYLQANGTLSFDAPRLSELAFDEFLSDPNRPVPYTETITPLMTNEYMIDDQRFAAKRPDVLVYQTDALKEDLTLAGPLTADLWVSTSAGDADWVVKLIDVFPADEPNNAFTPAHQKMGGYQMMVRSEVLRGRFRNSYDLPEPFVPNQPTRVRVELQDVLHCFQKGHRLMVQIQSTWFPLVDRNPQKYVPNVYLANPEDYQKATHRVYRSAEHQSGLRIPAL